VKLLKIQYNAPVTLSFVFLALAALVLAEFTNGYTNIMLFSVYRASPSDPLTYIRLLGHVLGHAGINHYMNNIIIILLLGPMLEEKYGAKTMIWMMVTTAFITGLLFLATSVHGGLLGASGIVYMMILLSSFANWKKGGIPLTLIVASVFFIGKEFIAGATTVSNVSHMTHIIGGVCGAVFGFTNKRG
jgi:membrane associated rhomboid family serine protease